MSYIQDDEKISFKIAIISLTSDLILLLQRGYFV